MAIEPVGREDPDPEQKSPDSHKKKRKEKRCHLPFGYEETILIFSGIKSREDQRVLGNTFVSRLLFISLAR